MDRISVFYDTLCCYVNIRTFTAAIGIGTLLIYKHHSNQAGRALRKRAAAKVEERNNKKWKVLEIPFSDEDEAICNLCADELQQRMASKKLSCEAVVSAFCRKARKNCFTDGLNAITEEFYDEAVAAAKKLDQTITPEMWKDARYPLLGLPISVKDSFIQKGADATCGMACNCYYNGPSGAPDDGLMVKVVREAGGIPFVRSNVPQLLFTPECGNNVWGRSSNPYSSDRTCGGSSGGEAALIGSQSSVVGLGSDIGGSVRIPALFCGIYGFLPTNARVSKKGMWQVRATESTVLIAAPGAMSSDTDGCAKIMRAMYSPTCWGLDPNVPHMPWNDTIYRMAGTDGKGKKKLRIAYYMTNDHFQPCSAALRALHEAKDALAARGHELVPLTLSPEINGWETFRLYVGFLGGYGNMKDYVDALNGEALYPAYEEMYRISNIPNWIRSIARPILKLKGEERKLVALSVTRSGGISVRTKRHLFRDLQIFRQRWLDAIEPYDCILSPGLPLPPFRHDTCGRILVSAMYTCLANLLQWPCGACPVTKVREDEECYPVDALPPEQQDDWAREGAKIMPGSKGLPMGVQITARPFCDELCLFAMKELECALEIGNRLGK